MKKVLVVVAACSTALGSMAQGAERPQKVSLDVFGTVCQNCAKELTSALNDSGIKKVGKLSPNKGKGPVRITGELLATADLAEIARTVIEANTPHRSQSRPGLAVVFYAQPNKLSEGQAQQAFRNLKGVDAKETSVNVKKGEISARINGKEKVSVSMMLVALKDAGINASINQPKKRKSSKDDDDDDEDK